MRLENPLNNLNDITPQDGTGLGWEAAVRLRVGVSGADGASSLAYHAGVPPGAGRARHANGKADEILIVLQGGGSAEIGGHRCRMRAGHCLFVPAGVPHSFRNDAGQDPAIAVGFYPFAATPDATGLVQMPDEEASDGGASDGKAALVHLDDVAPAAMDEADGWLISDFRLPIGRHTGSATTLFRARFLPGAVHKKHAHATCEEIYFVIAGSGIAGAGGDRVRVHGGHFHYVPKGVEHWLSNLSAADPIEVVGVYIGAGSVAETGYVYKGEVTPDDVALPDDTG